MKKLLFLIIILPFNIFALTYPDLNSKKVLIYDKTDDLILYEKNADEKSYIASITKIATSMAAIEEIKDLDEEITITKEMMNTVSSVASVAGLKVGDKVTYRDLLYASLVPSGADATNSLALRLFGSFDNYVKKMNELAKKIGLTNTHFANVTGLDNDDNYSNAKDVLKLLLYALSNKTFKDIYTTKEYSDAHYTVKIRVEATESQ